MAVLIPIGGIGAAGPVGPAGAAGVGVPAPNVTATAVVFYEPWANAQRFGFSGATTLPVSDPDYAHLNRVSVRR